MRGLGTVVNVVTVLAGTLAGLVIGRRFPERVRTTLLSGVGLVVLVIGFDEARVTRNVIFPLVAIVLGGLVGELLDIEGALESLGDGIKARVARGDGQNRFVEGFVSASLIFCVGPLAVLGSVQDGLHGDHQLLFVKAGLDGLVALILASTLGWGVALSALVVAAYQGGLTAVAGVADRVLSDRMVLEMTATGGVMVIGIGIRLLDLRPLRVASFLPALVIAPVAVGLFAR
ncbi:MAG: uncharacterized protein QOJ09_2126 [Actinomycetota bacterium]|nr:uncharacterized protein [Actinomycetota bacterium]